MTIWQGARPRIAPVEIISPTVRLRANVEVPGTARLSDLVNDAERFLILRDLDHEPEPTVPAAVEMTNEGTWIINKERIDVILETRAPEATPVMQDLRVVKDRYDVELVAGRFTVVGHAHLVPGADLTAFLAYFRPYFIPITDATMVYEGIDGTPYGVKVDTALVNRENIFSVKCGPLAFRGIPRTV